MKFLETGRMLLLTGCLASSIFTSGCATRSEIKQFQSDMTVVKERLERLEQQNRIMQEELRGLDKSVNSMEEESRRSRADIIAEMSSLREQTRYLQSLLDDTGSRMEKLLHEVERRAAPAAAGPFDSLGTEEDRGGLSDSGEGDVDAKELYDTAYLDYFKGNYELAVQGFEQYLEIFPNTEYSDNARYWLGEIIYAQQEFEQAFRQFSRVVDDYPRGDKVPAALLKMGYCQIHLKNRGEARKYLQRVADEYPASSEADLARARLREL